MRFRRTLKEDDEVIPTSSVADITFLLIIFFMVGTVFNVDRGIEMNLPQSTVQQDISDENVIISIDAAENLYLDGEQVGLGDVGTATLARLAVSPESFVLVKCDRGVRYRKVVDVLDELLQVGITNIALPTEKEGE